MKFFAGTLLNDAIVDRSFYHEIHRDTEIRLINDSPLDSVGSLAALIFIVHDFT